MSLSLTRAVIIGASLLASSAFAFAGAGDDAVKARQACMKASGAIMGVAVPIMKGEKPYDQAALAAAYTAHDAACADWTKFFGADVQKGETVETWAKPEIWTDAAGFEKAGGDFYNAYVAMTKATDEAGFKAAFPAVGAGCQGCHEKFRRPKS
jgi:cytochrome c556